jgi:phage-related protein
MLESGVNIISTILEGISNNPDEIVNTIFNLGGIIIKAVFDLLPKVLEAALQIGGSIVDGVWQGISNAWSWFTDKVSGFFSGIVDGVKESLGIHSPSRVFAAIGKNMAQGVGVGWDDEFGDIQDEINGSLDFSGGSASFSSVGGSVGGRPINITQNIYAQKKSTAQLMQEARWQAQMGVLASV